MNAEAHAEGSIAPQLAERETTPEADYHMLVVGREEIEAGDANRAALPTAVIRLETKVDAMTSELTALREDIRRIRVQGAPR